MMIAGIAVATGARLESGASARRCGTGRCHFGGPRTRCVIGAGRWLPGEIGIDPIHDRPRDLAQERRVIEATLFFRIGDEGGFHQHRRHVGSSQHREVGALHVRFVVVADALEAALISNKIVLDGMRREIENIQRRERVLLDQRQAKVDQVRNSFLVLTAISAIVGLLGSLAAVYLFSTGIVRRVRILEDNAELLARGDALMAMPDDADEIGTLGQRMHRASELLRARELVTIIDKARNNQAYLEACTPGYYNNEGKPAERAAQNGSYGRGPVAFVRLLEAWRAQGDFAGLELQK